VIVDKARDAWIAHWCKRRCYVNLSLRQFNVTDLART
jgi:hypothetical protein